MSLSKVISFAEAQFTPELGAPWRWADAWMQKPYQLIEATKTGQADENWCANRLIAELTTAKRKAGYLPHQKPKLYWRWVDMVRWDGETMSARLYLDGNPAVFVGGNPSKPRGRPTVGQVKVPELAQAA